MRTNEHLLIDHLQQHGASTSREIQAVLQSSQPTVSRLLATLTDRVVTLGKGRASRYAIAQPIGIMASQQPLWRMDESGQLQRVGLLSFLANAQIHLAADGVDLLFKPGHKEELPWFMSPLRAQGFLGRLNAAKLAGLGITTELERWDTHAILLVALHLHDVPGALLLGDAVLPNTPGTPVIPLHDRAAILDAVSADIARTLPAGSSAGGEQPKFLAATDAGDHVLVKFSPPLGTPYGNRWRDLLLAEALSASVLQRHGQAAASCEVVTTDSRTYLLSQRFDRIGPAGRKHVVALGAVHAAFVPGPYVNWASTGEALARQGRLTDDDARAADFMLQFGRLIGNTDMHSGNASLMVEGVSLAEMTRGKFSLAPAYDMLPMRFKPNPLVDLPDYAAFSMEHSFASAQVKLAAADYWDSLARLESVSPAFRALAARMASIS